MRIRSSRQSFLGDRFEIAIGQIVVGIVGLGGGGSQVVQQLAHVGFQRFVLFDQDHVEESNLTRLVGGTSSDAATSNLKVEVAKRTILGLQPRAEIIGIPCRWQDQADELRRCHLIFGCVDTFSCRDELEALARRYLINYIDIGMDVWIGADGQPVMGGQVALSMPGKPCLRCLGILTDEKLGAEALAYGDVGVRPQVVWANGILASSAVGLAVDLLANWTGRETSTLSWSYDGNRHELKPHWRSRSLTNGPCSHYAASEVGPPSFKTLTTKSADRKENGCKL